MRTLNRLAIKGVVVKNRFANKVGTLFAHKKQGVDGVVVALILVVVAVGAAILFRQQILTTISNIMTQANTNINTMFSGSLT